MNLFLNWVFGFFSCHKVTRDFRINRFSDSCFKDIFSSFMAYSLLPCLFIILCHFSVWQNFINFFLLFWFSTHVLIGGVLEIKTRFSWMLANYLTINFIILSMSLHFLYSSISPHFRHSLSLHIYSNLSPFSKCKP